MSRCEILENRRLVFGPAALAIVIFDAKQHAATGARAMPQTYSAFIT
jgi:hypothetical protein